MFREEATNPTVTAELVETGETRDRVGRKITPAPRREELVGTPRKKVELRDGS
jgi:hypothetical protein